VAAAFIYRNVVSNRRLSRIHTETDRERAKMEERNAKRKIEYQQEVGREAKIWTNALPIMMDSGALTNTVRVVVEAEGQKLEAFERAKLVEVVTCWLHSTATSAYKDFLAFRQPDSISFEGDPQIFLNAMSKHIPGLLAMNDDEKCAALFNYVNQNGRRSSSSNS